MLVYYLHISFQYSYIIYRIHLHFLCCVGVHKVDYDCIFLLFYVSIGCIYFYTL